MRTHTISFLIVALAVVLFGAGAFVACGGNGGAKSATDGGSDVHKGGGHGDAMLSPDVFGGGPGPGSCLALGSSCKKNDDCCSSDCKSGFCNFPACQSDGLACTANGQCCSLSCGGGKCTALNTKCSTIGNSCTSSSSCCSGFCSGGSCQPSSFCVQPGDACATNGDCCTGVCNIASAHTIGTCNATPPSGPANCGLTDGELCAGAGADGGAVYIDGGLPACGGACCSRACAPWGATGVLVCQPASGCHPVGDLCLADVDCCGSSGLPGGSGKPVTCDMSGGGPVGICRNPMGCKPNGDVCKLKTMSCNASCDCCAGNCEKDDTCKQDNVGVPRCTGSMCVDAGSACASSADCCGGLPCVPSLTGTPPYVCYGSSCVPSCGSCTNNADCCPGSSCEVPAGSTSGTCGPCAPVKDGGTPVDSGTPKDGAPPPPPPPPPDGGCALYGQVCTTSSQCCYGVPCTGGRCVLPIK